MIISILGAGVFGKALGKILTDNHHEVKYYDPYVYPDIPLERATYQANAIAIVQSARISRNIPFTPKEAPDHFGNKRHLRSQHV